MGEVLHRIEEARDTLVSRSTISTDPIFIVFVVQSASSETYLKKLDEFRKTTIGKAKVKTKRNESIFDFESKNFQNKKKEFDKTTQRYCAAVENNMKIPTKRSDLFQEVRNERIF
jgi:hypothetical protein